MDDDHDSGLDGGPSGGVNAGSASDGNEDASDGDSLRSMSPLYDLRTMRISGQTVDENSSGGGLTAENFAKIDYELALGRVRDRALEREEQRIIRLRGDRSQSSEQLGVALQDDLSQSSSARRRFRRLTG